MSHARGALTICSLSQTRFRQDSDKIQTRFRPVTDPGVGMHDLDLVNHVPTRARWQLDLEIAAPNPEGPHHETLVDGDARALTTR